MSRYAPIIFVGLAWAINAFALLFADDIIDAVRSATFVIVLYFAWHHTAQGLTERD